VGSFGERSKVPVSREKWNPSVDAALGCVTSLDLPTDAEQAEKEPQNFLGRHPSPVIIDEVQYAPRLFRHLKVVVDASRDRNGQFLLTGSQKFTLMKSMSESLAGRADIAELETLSFGEIHSIRPSTTIETIIVRGGFPELHANLDIDQVAFYDSILPPTWNVTCGHWPTLVTCDTSSVFHALAPCVLQLAKQS
jgi:hypothetical protein